MDKTSFTLLVSFSRYVLAKYSLLEILSYFYTNKINYKIINKNKNYIIVSIKRKTKNS